MRPDAPIYCSPASPVRLLLVLAALVALCWALRCATDPALAGGQKTTREIVLYGHTFPSALAILIDRSGSMRETGPGDTIRSDRFSLAIREARWVAEQASDEGRVRFYCFAGDVDAEPQGWIKTPDAVKLKAALAWAAEHEPAGTTDLAGAMDGILTLPVSPLGVVILTDGEPDTGPESTVERMRVANALRREPAIIGVVVLDPREEGHGDDFGREAAEAGGGAFVRIKARR